MPSKPRPKSFYAARDFSIGGSVYAAGDPVPQDADLPRLIAWGHVTDKPTKPNQTTTAEETS